VLVASFIRATEAANTFKTSVDFYQSAWCNYSEGSHFHNRRRENLRAAWFLLYQPFALSGTRAYIAPNCMQLFNEAVSLALRVTRRIYISC
jgi:hypothetical protein